MSCLAAAHARGMPAVVSAPARDGGLLCGQHGGRPSWIACAGLLLLLLGPPSRAQDTAPGAPSPGAPLVPEAYRSCATPLADPEAWSDLDALDAALGKEDWPGAATLLNRSWAEAIHDAAAPGAARLLTRDGILFRSRRLELADRLGALSGAARAGLLAAMGTQALPGAEVALGPGWDPAIQGSVVLGRPDHAALEVPPGKAWEGGIYARWTLRHGAERPLVSSVAARNFYYAYYPMQLFFAGGLILTRSHQEALALDPATGAIRWQAATDVPVAEQTIHQRNSPISSWYYFSDLGGWAMTTTSGARPVVIYTSVSRRAARSGNQLSFATNELIARELATGELVWSRGGAGDAEERLRQVTFAAPPTPCGKDGEVLAAPAISGDGFHVAAFSADGKLRWIEKVYDHDPAQYALLDQGLGHGASLAASGELILGAPGHGVVFALASSGEVLWVARYASDVRSRPADPRFAPGHPLLVAGLAVTAPFDGDALEARDARTGRLVWSQRLAAGYYQLLGADAERVYVMDNRGLLTAHALQDGAISWRTELDAPPSGRGLATTRALYVPAGKSVVVVSPGTGAVERRLHVAEDRVPDGPPGNLYLLDGTLYYATALGFAALEPLSATAASIEGLGVRERLLRGGRVARAEGRLGEALERLRQALASSTEENEQTALRAEILEVGQEEAVATRDAGALLKLFDAPELAIPSARRPVALLKSAAALGRSAPAEAAALYRAVLAGGDAGELAPLPGGVLATPRLIASSALRDLLAAGLVPPDSTLDERVNESFLSALTDPAAGAARLSAIALHQPHSLHAALANAALAVILEGQGRMAEALGRLEQVRADAPELWRGDERLRADLRRQEDVVRGGAVASPAVNEELLASAAWWSGAGPAAGRPWTRVFSGAAERALLVGTLPGSEPLPGTLVARDGTISRVGEDGSLLDKLVYAEGVRSAPIPTVVPGSPFEVARAHLRGESLLLATSAGLHEVLLKDGRFSRAHAWRSLVEAGDAAGASAGGAPTASVSGAVRKVGIARIAVAAPGVGLDLPPQVAPGEATPQKPVADGLNTLAAASLDALGNPALLEPDGTLSLLERRTGRARARSEGVGAASAGPPDIWGDGLIGAIVTAPPGYALHDARARKRLHVPLPSPTWKVIVVPGLALVADTGDGVQVRQLPVGGLSGVAGEGPLPISWRDATGRGQPTLVHADGAQVVVVDPGGRLVARALRSGAPLWEAPLAEGVAPVLVERLASADGGDGDLLIAFQRRPLPPLGWGVLSPLMGSGLTTLRIGLDGVERWSKELSSAVCVLAESSTPVPGGRLLVLATKDPVWRVRGSLLDLESGAGTDVFELPLEERPAQPPPTWALTRDGLAVGVPGMWALFRP